MERRLHEETLEGSKSHQSTLTGALALKNFTIPRKKCSSVEVLLERCPEESRDYSLIQTKLRESKLDTKKDWTNSWVWKDVRLVHNEELLKKFSEKRAEMRAKGRHGREMEERFCFLAASDQMTDQIYQHGLRVGSTTQHALGKPSYGVYLFRHVDVALKSTTSIPAKKLLIFKVLYGKVKKITPSLDWNKTQDPTVAFDCHMCKDAVTRQDTLHQQVLGSAVFLFDFNEKQELCERPRQCLPYAVVSFVPASNAILPVPIRLQLSPSMLPVGQVNNRFKACTVAERRGKGNTATVTFKHFGTPGSFEMDYIPQNLRVEALFQKTDMQNTQPLSPKQHWTPASEDSESSSSSVPVMDHTALSQSWPGKTAFRSNHKQITVSTHGRNDNIWDTIPQTPLGKISTIVYSSRVVKDPRLSRQEANQQTSCSEAEAAYTASGCDDRKCKPAHQKQEDSYGFAEKKCDSSMIRKEAQSDCPLKSSKNDQCVHSPTLPSKRLFKMKFQKYAAYFKMNEEERHQKIWSQENLSPDERQELADRVHFYEMYYQKYKKGLLFQKANETPKKTPGLSQIEPKENILQTKDSTHKQNPQSGDASTLPDNNDFVHMDKYGTTQILEAKHPDHPEPNTVMLTEEEKDQMQDYVDHPSGCLTQSPDKLSEQCLVLESSNLNLTDDKTDTQSTQFDLKHSSPLTCSSNEAKLNHSIEHEHELFRSAGDDMQENESTPGANLIEKSNTESPFMYSNNVMDMMETASCVEVSSCGTTEGCNLSPSEAEKQKHNKKSYSNVQEMDSFRSLQWSEYLEISPEINMKTVQQDNGAQELYKRLQIDQLLPCKNQKHVFSSRAYLTPRVMGKPTDTISKPKNETHSKAETNLNMRCWEELHLIVPLNANKTSTDIKEKLSLSQRFSKMRGLQTKLSGRNNRSIQTPETQLCRSEGHEENANCNAKLIQLLAQKYSKSKLHVKRRSEKAFLKKIHTILSLGPFLKRSKYVKKTHFWKAKKNLCRKFVSTEAPHETAYSNATSENLLHTSETVLTENTDQNPDHNSDANNGRQLLHIQGFHEANAVGSTPQDHCCPTMPVINKDLPPSLELSIIPEAKEKPANPTELCSENGSICIEKATKDFTSHTLPAMLEEEKASLIMRTSKDYRSTAELKDGNVLLKMTSETGLNPLNKEHFTMEMSVDDKADDSKSLNTHDCEASKTHMSAKNTVNSQITELKTNMTPADKVMDTSTNAEVLDNTTSDSKQEASLEALVCGSNYIEDHTVDNPALSGQCEISEQTKSSNTNLLSVTNVPSTLTVEDNCESPVPEQNKNEDGNSSETQLISKLRDYLTKFESTVKKQESVNEDLKERQVMWITLDSSTHKQQLFEQGQYCMVNFPCLVPNESDAVGKSNSSECTKTSVQTKEVPRSEHAEIGTDVCPLVPVKSQRGRQLSHTKRTSTKSLRRSSVISVSPDSTSALDIVKDNSPHPLAQVNEQNAVSPEMFVNNTLNDRFQMQRKTTSGQPNPSVNMNSLYEKSQENQSVKTVKIVDDGNVSSTFAENEYRISDISETLKMADQATSLTELKSLQSKCKIMLQHFVSNFERDQRMPFNQSFVSRCLILGQYLDHPPAEVDLKYEAVNSYLELQMMMEAWQFVENKINLLTRKPTFRSLLWYDPSLYGELYKGDVGFQQQSSLFASFQKILAQEGYSKLQEYYSAVSSLHQQLHAAPDASYYMYLKSKRELLEAEAALRNPRDITSFFLSVPIAAMINFGDNLEKLEKVYKVVMTFVETPSDQLPGTFDVGKAEHLSITCRYLQEKAVFIRSCREMISKISWFGIEHLLYDASKVLIWQDVPSHGVPSEVLNKYRNSNPQIIFGVTESGVTLVNKVEQLPPSMDETQTSTMQQSDVPRKRKSLQLWTSTAPSVAQNIKADKEVAYKMDRKRASHPATTQCDIINKSVNPLFQTTPATHVENPSPYYALPHRMDLGHWGMVGAAADWNMPNLVTPSLSMSHGHSEIHSHLQSKRQRTLLLSDKRRSLSDVQSSQWPSVSAPQATLRGDSCVTHSAFESVKYQQTNAAEHCPVFSQDQVNQFSLAMMQPYSLPSGHMNPSLVPPSHLSVQALTHVPIPSTITTIHYPYFLMNGQTYTTGSTTAINPETRYYSNTI